MRYLVSGAKGQLGLEIGVLSKKYKEDEFFLPGREFDITDTTKMDEFLKKNHSIDFLINCAAYTNVDGAENNQDQAFKVNSESLKDISKLSNKYGFKIIHISTDFVFDGNKSGCYNESDHPNPISAYGKSKFMGEQELASINNAVIIRTSWLYSEYRTNFVKKILEIGRKNKSIKVVSDQIGSPTYAKDLAEAILLMTKRINSGNYYSRLYHYSNLGKVSRSEMAEKILDYADINCKVEPVSSSEFNAIARRPMNSSFDNKRIIKDFNLGIRNWEDALKDCIGRLV